MNALVIWKTLRVLRWALWIGFVLFGLYISQFREQFFNQFGHLETIPELSLFGLVQVAGIVGLFEMMMRERAGIRRLPPPAFER
jgi:hypothetical protein